MHYIGRVALSKTTHQPPCDPQRPSEWKKYRTGMCEACWAGCCTLPVEASAYDLIRMELVSEDEAASSLKKIAKKLIQEKIVKSYRAQTQLFTLEQTATGDCIFLGKDRRCTIYLKRPEVCRQFPKIGPRPGYCPAGAKK